MPTKSQDRLTRWEVLNTNLKQHLDTLPELQPRQTEFEQIIAQDLALAAQVSQLTGTVRDLVRQRRTLATKGNRLRNLFVAALQNSFGPESQRMNEFGVRPRAFRRKKTENGPNSGTPSTEPATNPAKPAA